MKYTFLCLLLLSTFKSSSQSPTLQSKILTLSESKFIFNDSIKRVFNIKYPILFNYNYSDTSGNYYSVFIENLIPEYADKDSMNNSIRFLNLKLKSGELTSVWDYEIKAMPDFIVGTQSIYFNREVFEFTDFDNDSLIDPIIAYTTKTKFQLLVFYKQQLNSIELSFKKSGQRKLTINSSFYKLPDGIQIGVIKKLKLVYEQLPMEFPERWLKGMQKKKNVII